MKVGHSGQSGVAETRSSGCRRYSPCVNTRQRRRVGTCSMVQTGMNGYTPEAAGFETKTYRIERTMHSTTPAEGGRRGGLLTSSAEPRTAVASRCMDKRPIML